MPTLRAGVVDTVLRRGGDDDTAVFERARRLGFAGVEVVLRRGDLESGRLESLRQARAATGVEVPSLVLGFHNEDGGIADADPSAARRAADDVRDCDCVGARAGCRRRARAVLPPGRARRRGGRRPVCGRLRGAVPGGGRRGRDALLRGDAPGGRRHRARRARLLAGVRVLLRPREPDGQRARPRDGGETTRRPRTSRAFQGRARTAR